MKKFSFLFLAVYFFVAVCAFAQNNQGVSGVGPDNDVIIVNKKDLPTGLVKELESKKQLEVMKNKIETYGKWVGMGKEVGVAINDSLSALTKQADDFSKTGVGKFTMFLVAYKVLGKEVMNVAIGIFLMFIWLFLYIWYIKKNTMTRSFLKEKQKDGKATYEIINREKDEYVGERGVATLVFVIGVIVLLFNIF
jgi:hypothetical protein